MQVAPALLAGLLVFAGQSFAQTATKPLDTAGIAKAMGKEGERNGEMYKVSFPRSDLGVKVGDFAIKPALALTAWAAFLKTGESAVTYGDLVLVEDEINPVISKLEEKGVGLAALHNHLLHETPPIMYIHFVGYGDEVALATGIHEALALTKSPLTSPPSASAETKPELAKEIERIVGFEGGMGGGVFHIVVPRNDVRVEALKAHIPGSMGMNTPLNFQLEGGNAAINGDFMLLPREVNPVIKALRASNIEITSLHNHMLDDEPRLFFMHFWANDDALKLAKGLRAALDETGAKRP
jgi:hypothetical protein